MSCEKNAYKTKQDARKSKRFFRKHHVFTQFYQCPDCGLWHLTTTRDSLDRQLKEIDLQAHFREAIQSKTAQFIRRLSNKKTVWRIIRGKQGYIVTYNKHSKKCEINNWFREANN